MVHATALAEKRKSIRIDRKSALKGKVCFLVAEHPFLDARIFYKEAKSLFSNGYDVTMIVPRKDGSLVEPSGRLVEDDFLDQTFLYEGVRFVTYNVEKTKSSYPHQLHCVNTAQIDPLPSLLRELGLKEKADIYHAHEFSSCYDAIMIKRSLKQGGKRCRIIYDSHELDLDTRDPLVSQKRQVQKKKLLKNMCKELDAVITVSSAIEGVFHQLNSELQTAVLFNSPRLSPLAKRSKPNVPLVLGYVGRMEEQKGSLDKLYEILALTEDIQLRVKVIGGPIQQLKDSIPPSIQERIEWTGWLSYSQLHHSLAEVDIGWIDVDVSNSLNREYSLPNKFFTYLERGIPPLVNKCLEMESFIKRYQCGFVLNHRQASSRDYAKVLRNLDENRGFVRTAGLNGREVMEQTYSWDLMQERLLALYQNLFPTH